MGLLGYVCAKDEGAAHKLAATKVANTAVRLICP
jgi:hypothetical protein